MTGYGLFVPSGTTNVTYWAPLNFANLYGNTWVHGAGWSGELNGQWAAGPGVYPPNGTTYPPIGVLGLLTEQPAPSASNGNYSYNPSFDAGALTGFTPLNGSGYAQLGNLATGTTSTLQGESGVFGAYVIGDEYAAAGQSLAQMTAQYNFPLNTNIFSNANAILTGSINIQFPTATNAPYMHLNIGFTGPGSTYFEFVYSILIATIGTPTSPGVSHTAGVGAENAFELILPLGDATTDSYMTTISGAYTGSTWSGYLPLSFSISYTQFAAALEYMATRALSPNPFIGNTDPALYFPQQTHLNAEIQTTTAGTTMGWSAKNWTLTLTGAAATPCATPTFSPNGSTFSGSQVVTIACATVGASIYYTTDGSTPTTASTLYTGAVTVTNTTTLKAIASDAPAYTQSAVASATFTLEGPAATPTFSPGAGNYSSAQTVTISDATVGSTIHYTTDGTTPTTSSTVYSSPISVSSSQTVKAIAAASGYTTSAVGSAAYTISSIVNYLGANASGLSYYDIAQPFLNLLKNSGTNWLFSSWNTTVGATDTSTAEEQFLQVDSNGYVTSLVASGEGSQTYTAVGTAMNLGLGTAAGASGPYPPGPYTFQMQGAGTLVFGDDVTSLSSPSAGLSVSGNTLTSTLAATVTGTVTVNIPSPSAGIRLWVTSITTPGTNYPQAMALYESAYATQFAAGQIAHPLWLAAYANYGVVRGMDMFNTLHQEVVLNFSTNLASGSSGTFAGSIIIGSTDYSTWPLLSGTYNFLFATGQTIAVTCTFGSANYTFSTPLSAALPAPSGLQCHAACAVQGSWAQRATATQCSYTTIKGIPYEVFAQMCNELNGYQGNGADCWINIPGASAYFDSTYASSLASLMYNGTGTTLAGFTGLNSANKTYVELCNEVWNFPNTNSKWFFLAQGALYPSWPSSVEYYATQVAGIGDAWFGVYGSALQYGGATTGRAVVSMGGQFTSVNSGTGNSIYYMKQMMASSSWTSAAYTHHIGSFHYAHYFNGNPSATDAAAILATANPVTTFAGCMYSQNGYSSVPVGGYLGSLITSVDGVFAYWAANPQPGGWQSWPVYAYEGGTSWLQAGNSAAWSTFLNQFSRTIYRGYCNYDPTSQLSSGPGLMPAMVAAGFAWPMQFQGTSPYNQFGNWGALENVMQPTTGTIGGPSGVPYNWASLMAYVGITV